MLRAGTRLVVMTARGVAMSVSVEFRGICKDYGGGRVLHDVCLALAPGRVHALIGENGAGKSTLMKILSGHVQPTAGTVLLNGQPRQFDGPRDAEREGIATIHQEFNLAEHLSIAQNMFLGHEKRRGWLLDDAAMRNEAREMCRQVGLQRDPDTPVRQLIVAEKQLVEIARALSRRARLLIMDEPTATLTPAETGRLFGLIQQLRADGATLIYISHKLDEVERITDEVTVMRDGRCVARAPTAQTTRQQMASLMVGRELSDMFAPKDPVPEGPPVLRVQGFSVPDWARDVSFDLRAGEILGFAGLVGSGRTELFEGILGLRPRSAGTVELPGTGPLVLRSPRHAAGLGLTYLSEDRKGKALHVQLGLRENLTLMALERHAKPLLDPGSERRALQQAIREFDLRGGDGHRPAGALSGGNQQKLAIARVLHPQPKVVVLDEPTRGVDVGAKRDIYFLIQRLAREGRGVIVISSELVELIGLCHRVLVMRAGRVQACLQAEQLTEEELIAHATNTHQRDERIAAAGQPA
jgi:ribose transport system ATP-binding protein